MIKSRAIYESYSPLVYKINYMLYAAMIGALMMYIYVTSYGGEMPVRGSFMGFITDFWDWFLGLGVTPMLLAVYNHWREKRKRNRRNTDR